jgi:hypothetical protein
VAQIYPPRPSGTPPRRGLSIDPFSELLNITPPESLANSDIYANKEGYKEDLTLSYYTPPRRGLKKIPSLEGCPTGGVGMAVALVPLPMPNSLYNINITLHWAIAWRRTSENF